MQLRCLARHVIHNQVSRRQNGKFRDQTGNRHRTGIQAMPQVRSRELRDRDSQCSQQNQVAEADNGNVHQARTSDQPFQKHAQAGHRLHRIVIPRLRIKTLLSRGP